MALWFVDLVAGDDAASGKSSFAVDVLNAQMTEVAGQKYIQLLPSGDNGDYFWATSGENAGLYRIDDNSGEATWKITLISGDNLVGSFVSIAATDGPLETVAAAVDVAAASDAIYIKSGGVITAFVPAPYLATVKQISIPAIVACNVWIPGPVACQVCNSGLAASQVG